MKMIPTKIHARLDYLVGCMLLILPGITGLDVNRPAGVVPMLLGLLIIAYSLLTKYELGLKRIIPLKTHLIIDFFAGSLLAASPWIFDFAATTFRPHLIIGIFIIIVSVISSSVMPEEPGSDTIV